ncbi:hypothetical protein SAMN05880501_10765 [Ureibacillus xyleni]|uniref:Phage terminase small subunit n=1 Tax=Ureibacillus xyleni TaxID=614648 RepID=A0A285SWY9_9BACL|nr:hypothetical protein [Ureibacillus xyleni]SOC12865.1 hypothetical protein SAMN05880501_10765 [Ureibacillus xyleni]
MAIYTKEEKEKLIKKELSKLKRTYNNLPKNKQPIADKLIIELAFMAVTLDELKQEINETGVIDEMPQGSYSILREHPAVKTYNTTIQRYSTLYKQLSELYPKEEPTNNKSNDTPDPLQVFLEKHK